MVFHARVGHAEAETHCPTFSDMGSSQNGPIEVPI